MIFGRPYQTLSSWIKELCEVRACLYVKFETSMTVSMWNNDFNVISIGLELVWPPHITVSVNS